MNEQNIYKSSAKQDKITIGNIRVSGLYWFHESLNVDSYVGKIFFKGDLT